MHIYVHIWAKPSFWKEQGLKRTLFKFLIDMITPSIVHKIIIDYHYLDDLWIVT